MMQRRSIMQSRIIMREDVKKSSEKSAHAEIIKYSLGNDIGKEEFDACLSQIDINQHVKILGTSHFKNTRAGFVQLENWVRKKLRAPKPLVCVMEATGVYYENLALYLDDRGFDVCVVLPNRVKQYMRSRGYKSKNDKIDSIGISQMGAEQQLERWKRPAEQVVHLRQTTRLCESFQQTRTALNNQLEALRSSGYDHTDLEKVLLQQIRLINKQIETLKSSVEQIIEADPELDRKVKNITAIKGVGVYTVAVVLAETGFFEMFHSLAQLTSYAGYDVIENQSSKRVGRTRISKKGNAHIRRAMHMPALSIKRFGDATMTALWERVYERTRIKMKAYVAVQRKLLLLIYTLWKKDQIYQPGWKNPMAIRMEEHQANCIQELSLGEKSSPDKAGLH